LHFWGYCASRAGDLVAGRWPTPHPSWPFCRCRPGPPGSSRNVHHPRPKPRNGGLRGLILSFRALRGALEPPLVGSSSHGIRCPPPAGIPFACPLPGAEAPFGPTLPDAGSCSALVVSHHHNGFLHARVTGLLHPATGQGFAAFHACRHRTTRRWASNGTIPATRFTPFEDFPSSAAVLHHCSLCLPAVTVLPGMGADVSRCPFRPPPTEVGAYTHMTLTRESPTFSHPEGCEGPVSR
jgi:hypothetical protein